MSILEGKVRFYRGRPAALVVKVHVGPLLVLLRAELGLIVALEPRQEVLVVSPRLLFQLASGEVLVRSALLEVEDEEERICGELFKDSGVVKHGGRNRGEVRRGAVRVARGVLLRSLRVSRVGRVSQTRLEHLEVVQVVFVHHRAQLRGALRLGRHGGQ